MEREGEGFGGGVTRLPPVRPAGAPARSPRRGDTECGRSAETSWVLLKGEAYTVSCPLLAFTLVC